VSEELSAFRHRLRQALTVRGITQSELARRVEVRQATISQWFSSDAPAQPKAEQLIKLPRALEVNGHWLLTGEGTMDDRPTEAQLILEGIRRILETPRTPLRPADAEESRRATKAHQQAARAQQLQREPKPDRPS